ncbi:MAG TPA: ABC-F family ATP-binding cassette domain-containing protein [Clostridia bacterium]|nr:ABC-F family ATP-binding cassette domain-containing protein [Clostridia bacterium]
MLKVSKVSKFYESKCILKQIEFSLNLGEKIGLVGSNGIGKSTLMRIIAGFEEADDGIVEIDNPEFIGYLRQEFNIIEESETINSFIKKEIGIEELENNLKKLEKNMGDDIDKIEKYCELQEKYSLLDGYNFDYKLDSILNGLGLGNEIKNIKIEELSGGQKNKVMIALVLLKGAELILLDEPTNNLDLKSIKWLENYLVTVNVPFIIVSHDRRFLNKVINKTIEIDEFERTCKEYPGNYSQYLEFKIKEEEKQLELYVNQQIEIKTLQDSIKQKKDWAAKGRKQGVKDNDKYTRGYERDRSSGLASKAKQIEKQIQQIDKIERPKTRNKLQIKINPLKLKGSLNIFLKDLVCGYKNGFQTDSNSFSVNFGEKIVIIGDNGSGKTTFLKTLMKEQEPISGNLAIGNALKIGYIAQDTKEKTDLDIDDYIKNAIDYEKLEDKSMIYTIMKQFNFSYEDKNKKYSQLSPGERTRLHLAIFSLLDINTLVLDEPTNHLDIEALEALEEVLENFEGTVIAISHDREFIEKICPDQILEMVNGKFRKIKVENIEKNKQTKIEYEINNR